jgi:arylsulfatase A-like enzyme
MSARLLHSALLGAMLTSVSAFLELLAVLGSHPYQRDYGVFLHWFPYYVATGASLGVVAAICLPVLSRRLDRQRHYGLHLAGLLLAGGFLGVVGLLRISGHLSYGPLALDLGLCLLSSLGLYLLFYAFAKSRMAWVATGFTTPWFSTLCLLALLGFGLIANWLPPLDAGSSSTLPAGPAVVKPTESKPAPNVLLVVLDTVAANHLGTYGYHRATSPELDRVASESVLFEQAFAAAPWTLPSHASIFTGLHPTTHQAGWQHLRLPDGQASAAGVADYDFLTLSEELQRRGYQTCGVSEKSWLTDRHGLTQGYSNYYDFSIPSVDEKLFLPKVLQKISQTFGHPLFRRHGPDKGGKRIIKTALNWLTNQRTRQQDQPFFMFLNLNEAHSPYLPPKGFEPAASFLPAGLNIHDLDPGYFGHAKDRKTYNLGDRDLLDNEIEIQQALYDGLILYQDQLLGQLFQGLRDMQLMEDTLIVITADHGEEFNEQGRFGHQMSLADRLLHVPLIMRYPSLLPAGTRISDLVSLVDIFPTILGILERQTALVPPSYPDLDALEGFNLVELILGESATPRDWILAHCQNPASYLLGFPGFTDPTSFPLSKKYMHSITALRSQQDKFFQFGNGRTAFLNLSMDPSESAAEKNAVISSDPAHPEVFAQRLPWLLNRLLSRRELLVGMLLRSQRNGPDHSENGRSNLSAQALEQLGYMGEGHQNRSALPLPKKIFR